MRAIGLALLCMFALASAGCLRKTEFQCAGDSSCGAGGHCEATGYCSFVDGECTSGRRYDSSAGSLAGQCTSGGNNGVDASTTDTGTMKDGGGGTDTPAVGCPGGYSALPNSPGHVYKVLAIPETWPTQESNCQLTSASSHLAIPDNLTELTDLDAFAAASNYWVGITDAATEMTWLTVLGMPQTFLPWQPPAPDNNSGGQGEDCVESLSATHTFNDRRCNDKLPAVCECTP